MTGTQRRRTAARLAALGVAAGLALTACSSASSGTAAGAGQGSTGSGELTLWAHKGNAPAEAAALESAVAGFNGSQSDAKVTVKFIPEADYPTQVGAASRDALPDILEVDGPTVAARVREKKLVDLSGLVAPATVGNLTGPIRDEGTIDGKLYSVAQFNGAIGIYANKKLLDAAGVKYPTTLAEAWTAEEFTAAVRTLAAKNTVLPGKSLDLKLNYGKGGLTGEFGTFAYAPLLWSAGADLIRDGRAEGAINSDAAVSALSTVASWKPFVTPNTDDKDFTAGKVALSYVGHWAFPDYQRALGKDLLALPLPDFGKGAKAGAGSWAWGVSSNSKNPKAAAAFLDYLLSDKNIATMVATNAGVPATKTALAASTTYAAGGPLALWGEAAGASSGTACVSGTAIPDQCVAVVRPLTAGYPTVTLQFANALDAVFKGAPAKATLDKAAQAIDTDFADHDGYK